MPEEAPKNVDRRRVDCGIAKKTKKNRRKRTKYRNRKQKTRKENKEKKFGEIFPLFCLISKE